MEVTSAQLRAARACLGWTMEKVALTCGLHRRTIIRLENDERYAQAQPTSLKTLVALYREHCIILEGSGLVVADIVDKSASAAVLNMHVKLKSRGKMVPNS